MNDNVAGNRWRTVDIVVASVIAVAFGVVFWAWGEAWSASTTAFNFYPPARAVLNGVWLVPAVLAPLIIRKPGAGVYAETVAAVVSVLLGSPWGLIVILYGLFQGFAAEFAFAATSYRFWRLPAALVSGTLAGAAAGLLDILNYYPAYSGAEQLGHTALSAASGLLVGGLGSFVLVRALAPTGVLDRFPAGRHRIAV